MRKKRTLIGVLILCLSVGFASIATNLIINNTTSIGKNINDFDVYFSGAILDGVDKSNELINKSNKKEIYFTSNNLKYSDDESILEYEITNNSSNYDASVNIKCEYTSTDTSINNRITITENPTSLTIEAKSIGNGNIIAKLNEMATESIDIPIICTLTANAIERNSKEDKTLESITYGISGYLVSVEGNPLKDKYLAVYSEKQIVKTDGTGYFFVSNLERGNHTIYYLDEDKEAETSEIKANISTNKSEEIKFNNGIKIEDVRIGTNKEIYTLTLNLNYEGAENQERQIIKGQRYNELPTPTRDGYEFLGWYTSETTQDETTKVSNDDTYNVSDNQTIYAGWKQICPYQIGHVWNFDYTGDEQSFEVEKGCSGTYMFELWGASGAGNSRLQDSSGKGGYTSGELDLTDSETLFVYVGEAGSFGTPGNNTTKTVGIGGKATFNGGGAGGNAGGGQYPYGSYSGGNSGGGATDIRIKNGEWNNLSSLTSRIMVAGGGGGFDYDTYQHLNGGNNLKLIGENGYTITNENGNNFTDKRGIGGTQTTGYAFGYAGPGDNSGVTGYCSGHNGGGGGYYGGTGGKNSGGSCHKIGGGAGSSYISGYIGSVAVTSEGDITPKTVNGTKCSNGTNILECSYHYSRLVFNNPIMLGGNETMPTHDNNGTMVGNIGNGYARITLLKRDIDS